MVETTAKSGSTLPDGSRVLPMLTDKQQQVLVFIHTYAMKNRDYPTTTEIGERMGVSKQAIASLFGALIRKGYAYRDKNFSERNIRLTDLATEKMELAPNPPLS